jgi:hypothetical protein
MALAAAILLLPPTGEAQQSARDAAPVDFTGVWVAPVMEDWRWRMVTPLRGDSASIPIRPEARPVLEAWDPAADEANGLECKAYGAPAIMRIPGRIRVTWADDETLLIETDNGMQTRRLHFGASPGPSAPSRQGHSVARWGSGAPRPPSGVGFLGGGPRIETQSNTLEVTTTDLLEGYLRKNGVPYSNETTVTEYFDQFTAVDGTQWFTVTTVVNDPVWLARDFVTTTDFRREPDESGWSPRPCTAY